MAVDPPPFHRIEEEFIGRVTGEFTEIDDGRLCKGLGGSGHRTKVAAKGADI